MGTKGFLSVEGVGVKFVGKFNNLFLMKPFLKLERNTVRKNIKLIQNLKITTLRANANLALTLAPPSMSYMSYIRVGG